MPDEAPVKSASWLGDAVEEFKKAPPAAKIGIVVALVAAAGIGYYEYSKNKAANTSGISGASTPSTDTQGAQGFPTVPGGNTGQVPVLPGGLQPIFDAAGNLIGFQPAPPTTGTTGGITPPPTPTPTPTPKPKPKPKGRPDNDKGGEGSDKGKLPDHTVKGKAHSVSGPGVKAPTGTQRGHKPGPNAPERKTPPHPETRKVFRPPPGPAPTPVHAPAPAAHAPTRQVFRSPPPFPAGRGTGAGAGGRTPG